MAPTSTLALQRVMPALPGIRATGARRRHPATLRCALNVPLLAAGCASYHPTPLPEQDSLEAQVAELELPAAPSFRLSP